MKKIILLIIYFYFSISLYVNAQSLSSLLNDKTKTYKDIQTELRKNENYLKNAPETWQSTTTECGDVIVKSGGTLTINGATINLEGDAEFSVEIGGILIFNSGIIQ